MAEEQGRAAWHRQPIWYGLVGLALMVAGWKLTAVAPVARDAKLAELRQLAGEGELGERIDRVARRESPYRLPGRLTFLAGLLLFVAAGVRMYQAPRRREAVDEEGEAGQAPPDSVRATG